MSETGFDEEQLRYDLIDSTGKELKKISTITAIKINDQLTMIDSCSSSFENVTTSNLSIINSSVAKINSTFSIVATDAKNNSSRLSVVTDAMEKLEEDFEKISSLVKTINSIADQTNLLALNATIEAARAGEHGKGFAVVANEVKELSKTTKDANKNIQSTLNQISASIKSLSEQIASTSETISGSLNNVESSNAEIASITTETEQLGHVIEENLSQFKKLSNQAIQMSSQANELTIIGDTFTYLLEMMNVTGIFKGAPNPLERLVPLLEDSEYRNDTRFSNKSEKEIVLKSDDILISATDTKGVITFANHKFCEIVGYTNEELNGKPHNIIRHPDMPKTAFQDLWSIIKDGNLWSGIVKNTTKSGEAYYWVKAMIFPCYEDGKIIGYLSVRKKPSREEIDMAIEAYKQLP